jgi:hypothetical protein
MLASAGSLVESFVRFAVDDRERMIGEMSRIAALLDRVAFVTFTRSRDREKMAESARAVADYADAFTETRCTPQPSRTACSQRT